MALANELILIAQSLLAEFGQSVTFTNNSVSAYDPTTATKTSAATNYTGYVYVSKFDNREIGAPYGSTVIKADDLKVIASDMTRTPEEGDILTIGTTTYRIMHVSITNVTGIDVLYNLVARK